MRTTLFTLALLCLGMTQASQAGERLPHAYLRQPAYCGHYDYRLAFDYPWHHTNWSTTPCIRLPTVQPGEPVWGPPAPPPPAPPPPAPPAVSPPLGARRASALERTRLAMPNPVR